MKSNITTLQRNVGIGGAITVVGLLAVGFPIWRGMEGERTVVGFFTDYRALVFGPMMVLFVYTAVSRRRIARVIQVAVLATFGAITLALADTGALTGLAIGGVGLILAAQYGLFRKATRLKVSIAVSGTIVALGLQAVLHSADVSIAWTTLQFVYNSFGALGLAAGYILVLRDASLTASRRQERLEAAIQARTTELRREVTSRTAAENAAKVSASEAEALAQERLALIREIHHRARNSLQMTLTLLESSDLTSDVEAAETVNRVRAIGLVYDLIDPEDSLDAVVLGDYLERLTSHIQMSHQYGPVMVAISGLDSGRARIEPTVSLGLLIHEIVGLICDRAFDRSPGAIAVVHERSPSSIRLIVKHDRRSLPSGFDPVDASKSSGLALFSPLLDRLHARFEIRGDAQVEWHVAVPAAVLAGHESHD